MTDQKLTQITNVTSLVSTDEHYVVAGGTSRAMTTKAQGQWMTGMLNVKRDFDAVGDGVANDDTEAAAAVAAAFASGDDLYWPDGTFLTTLTIPNLHDVRHFGPGIIKRGTDTFAVAPKDGDTNVIYVAASGGSDTNDGLSSSEPFATIQAAFDVLPNYGPVLDGTWKIQLAAGTYTDGAKLRQGLQSSRRIEVLGPTAGHPTVPTAIIDGTGASASHALFFQKGAFVKVQDIKAQDWTGTLQAAVSGIDFSDVWTRNVHADNNAAGVFGSNGCRLRVEGGILNACTVGVRCVNHISFTIGHGATQLSEGPQITNCTQAGVLAQEASSGHVDWTTLDGNGKGLELVQLARIHLQGSDLKNNTIGAALQEGAFLFENTTNVNEWNDGTVDANTKKWDIDAFSHISSFSGNAQSEIRIVNDLTGYSHTGDTVRTVLASIYTLPAYFFIEEPRKLRVVLYGEYTTNTAANYVGIDFSGAVMEELLATGTPASGTSFVAEFHVWATGSSSQALHSVLTHSSNGVRAESRARASVMTSSRTVDVTVRLAASGDTVTINRIEAFLTG